MKNKLKRYNDFINESSFIQPKLDDSNLSNIDRDTLLDLRTDFAESVLSMADELSGSFSDMCKKINANPEGDYQEMQKELDNLGWNFESIKNLFSEQVNQTLNQDFFEWISSNHYLESKNGHCDVYLYFTAKNLGLDQKRISLGGGGWAEYNDEEEIIIRYKYGYHQTPYGQLFINDLGMMDEYQRVALEYLQKDLKENWSDILIKISNDRKIRDYISSYINMNKYSVVEEDRLIIFCDDISKDLNSKFGLTTTSEDVSSLFTRYLKWVMTEIQIIDGDLIIWNKFDIDA